MIVAKIVPDCRERWVLPVVLLHVAALVVLALRYTVEIPRADEWRLITKYGSEAGSLWEQLRTYHNQSHLFLTHCILDLLSACTRGSVLARVLLNISTACLTYACLARSLRQLDDGSPRWAYTAALTATSSAVLAVYQSGNWLWGVQFCVYACVAAACCGWAVLTGAGGPLRRVSWACLFGILSTYSFAAGLLYWPASLVLLWVSGERQRIVWRGLSACGAAVLILYLGASPGSGPFNADLNQQTLIFFIRFIGSCYGHGAASWAGVAGLMLMPLLLTEALRSVPERGRRNVAAFAAAVIVFVVLNAALAAIFRAGHDVGGGAANRYVTYSCYYWLALFWLALLRGTSGPRPGHRTALWAAVMVPAIVLLYAPLPEMYAMQEVQTARHKVGRWLVRTAQWEDERLGRVLGEHPDNIRRGAEVLRRKGYSPFEDLPPGPDAVVD